MRHPTAKNIVLKVIIFQAAVLIMVSLGLIANSYLCSLSDLRNVQKDEQEEYSKFKSSYDPKKKTIVVIGRSTSLFSFVNHSSYNLTKGSFADNLRPDANVLNLSSVYLRSPFLFYKTLNRLKESAIQFDFIMLENLNYFRPSKYYMDPSYLEAAAFCGGHFLGSLFSSDQADDRKKFYVRECKVLAQELEQRAMNLVFRANPCEKKFRAALNFAFEQEPQDRIQVLTDIQLCDRGKSNSNQLSLEIAKNIGEFHIEEIRAAFGRAGMDSSKLDNAYHELPVYEIRTLDLISISRNLDYLHDHFGQWKFVVFPSVVNENNDLQELPVFSNRGKMQLFSLGKDLRQVMKENGAQFFDVFLDGDHSLVEVQEWIAQRIKSEFLK